MDRDSLTQSEFEIDIRDLRSRGIGSTLRHTTFRSLKHRDYRLYFFGQLVSFIGSWMQSAALMWLVFEQTNDALWPPLMLVATVGPTLLLAPLGGMLADRFPKKKIITLAQCGFLLSSLCLILLLATGYAVPGVLLMVAFANGLIQSVDIPTRLAFVPDLVPKRDLINAVSLNALLFNSARAIGPALAGVVFLIADHWPSGPPVFIGSLVCFAFNAVSYGGVLAALRRIRAGGEPLPQGERAGLFAGLGYLREHPRLAALLALTGLLSIFAWPALTLFPAYTKFVLGHAEKEYSLLVSALGCGALVGALTTATYGSIKRRGLLLIVGAALTALALFGLSFSATIRPAAVSAAVLGFGLILFLSTGQSTLQLSVDGPRRGRVLALWAMTLSASAPLGHLIAGFAARVYPLPDVLMVMGAGAGITVLLVAALARSGLKRG